MRLGQDLLRLDREREAEKLLNNAFEAGRGSGSARGREVAAIAAMLRGDLETDDPERRRNLYETASRLGQLSGREGGKAVCDAARSRLRHMRG